MTSVANPVFSPLLASAAMSGPDVDLNPTLALIQFVIFAALLVVLKPLLLDPMLRVFEAREKRTDGAKAEARDLQSEAGELLRKYEKELETVNRVAAEERDHLRAETARLEAKILDEAREVTARLVEQGRERVAAEVGALKIELAARLPVAAREIATAVLGREVR